MSALTPPTDDELLARLIGIGFPESAARRILEDWPLAESARKLLKYVTHVHWCKRESRFMKTRPSFVNGKFNDVDTQIAAAREWNDQFSWGFTEAEFAEARRLVPEWPRRDPFIALVLVPYLDSVQSTFDHLWRLARDRQHLKVVAEETPRVRLWQGLSHQRGLKWETIKLDADRGISVARVRERRPDNLPHAGVLAAAAHHPFWIEQMDWRRVPCVKVPGYEVVQDGNATSCSCDTLEIFVFNPDDHTPWISFHVSGSHGGATSLAVPCFYDD